MLSLLLGYLFCNDHSKTKKALRVTVITFGKKASLSFFISLEPLKVEAYKSFLMFVFSASCQCNSLACYFQYMNICYLLLIFSF